MENSLEIIENIMQPYFEKQEIAQNTLVQINTLKLRLEKLLDNKEKEIQEYIDNNVNRNTNFYSSYGSMIRKDLELAYKEREESLRQEIENLETKNRFNRVDLRELVEIKEEARKQLISQKKALDLELQQQKINFDMAMLELSKFQYEYNDQNQVVNGDAFRKIYEKSNEISDRINNIKNLLTKIEEYLNLTEITKEEASVIMMSMTPWEKQEYDKRKALEKERKIVEELVNSNDIDEVEDAVKEELTIDEPKSDNIESDETTKEDKFENLFDDDLNEGIESEEFKPDNIEIDEITEDKDNLDIPENELKTNSNIGQDYDFFEEIYNDIENEITNLKTVNLQYDEDLQDSEYRFDVKDSNNENYVEAGVISSSIDDMEVIKLPCGEFVNQNDIYEGIKNLYKKNKKEKKVYTVEESQEKFKISRRTIRKLKRLLKKCSTIKLVRDKKLTESNLIRVHGKEKTNKIFSRYTKFIGKGDVPHEGFEGKYVSKDEVISVMKNLVTKKAPYWFKNIVEKIKGFNDTRLSETMYSIEEETKAKTR